jgi:cytochrome c oxidase subunit II
VFLAASVTAKFVAITLVLITVASAIPILAHLWAPPANISAYGYQIDKQMAATMISVGICFIAAQFILAAFIWMASERRLDETIRNFPGGAKVLVITAFLLVGIEVLALGFFGTKAWADVFLKSAARDSIPVQVQAGQFAFYFRYPGPDGKFGPLHPDKINEASQNFFGLDVDNDADSKDDIVTAEMGFRLIKKFIC